VPKRGRRNAKPTVCSLWSCTTAALQKTIHDSWDDQGSNTLLWLSTQSPKLY